MASAASPAGAPSRGRRALAWGLRLLGPVLLVILLARLPDRERLAGLLLAARPGPFALALLLNLLAIHLKVVRWRVILGASGVDYPLRDAWLAFCASMYLGMVTPGRVGDALRAHYVRRDTGLRYAEGLASVTTDRLCDLVALAALVAIAIARFGAALGTEVAAVAWSLVALIGVAPLVLLVPGVSERLGSRLYRRLGSADGDGLDRFLAASRAQLGRPLLQTLPLTLVGFLVAFAQGWLIARSLGLALPFLDVACLLSVASLLGLLPISISGVGVREAFFAAVFPALGLGASAGVGFGLAVFAVLYVATAAIGAVAWQLRPPPVES